MLSSNHRTELLSGSGLTEGIVSGRGYETIDSPQALLTRGFNAEQAKLTPALLIPLHWGGNVVQHQIKPDSPRVPKGARKPAKYETPAGSQPRLDCHPDAWPDLRDPTKPLWVIEGIKKSDSGLVRGLCAIGLIGVYGFLGKNEKGGVCTLAEWDDVPLKGKGFRRKVYICFDSDAWTNANVMAAMVRLGRMLRRRGADVTYIRLAPKINGEKVGLDDYWLLPGSSPEALLAMEGHPETSIAVNQRDLAEIVQDGIDALVFANDPPTYFVRDSEIATIVKNERGVATIQNPTVSQVRLALSEATRWHDKKGPVSPPREVAESVHGKRGLPFPPIIGITKGPLLSPKGIISSEYGYCPDAKMWLDAPAPEPFIGGAATAAAWLRKEIFSGFDFETESDWAHTLALCLLPIVRPVIEGNTPLHLIGAPVQGAGKGLLGKVCLMITQGDRIAMTPMSSNEEETRKRITAVLADGKNYLFIDNITGSVASAALSVVLTNGEWVDRKLGVSGTLQLGVTQILVATANNPVLDKDLIRRSLRIWIDPGVEHPEDREGFRPIEKWVRENRPQIQGALLAIVRAWTAAGMPLDTAATYGSFEEWAGVMGGLLMVAGVPGFLGNTGKLRDQSGSLESAWSRFYLRWERVHVAAEVSTAQVFELFMEDDELAAIVALNGSGERYARIQFGLRLSARVGVVAAGLRVLRAHDGLFRLEAMAGRLAAERMIEAVEPIPERLIDIDRGDLTDEPLDSNRVRI